MSAYTPGDSGSPDAEPTRRLRTSDTRAECTGIGRVASMKHLYIRFRAAWRSMKNPEASPEEMGYVPHLRSRLIAILVMALGVACLIIGLSTYVTLQNSLYQQAESNLEETSHRVAQHTSRDGKQQEVECDDLKKDKSTFAPGQASGTLITCVDSEGSIEIASKLGSDGTIRSLSPNDQVTLGTLALNSSKSEEREVTLEAGTYLIQITPKANSSSDAQVVGIPLNNVQQTLTIFVIVVSIGSIAVMVGAGVAGSYIIRRTMKPLERVSAVATDVAHLDLEEHTISSAVRVDPRDSDPRTEVGAVGYALNQLLDNVNSALEVRERTEHQIRAFIADASHELRTPLAAIKGYSDMLRWTEPLSDSGQSSLARIDSQTERMSRLVEDLLTLARLDEGREPKLETVDLTELLVECTSDMQAAARTHVWHLDVPHEPVEVVADRSQMQHVILNLLSNARKHTDEGTRVIAGLSVDRAHREAVVSVVDNGPGIDPEFLPKIFDRFTRADKARSGSDGTTGLGLAIVQAIVQAHGGSIQVQSQPGHTVFMVRLPLGSVAL